MNKKKLSIYFHRVKIINAKTEIAHKKFNYFEYFLRRFHSLNDEFKIYFFNKNMSHEEVPRYVNT